MGASRRRGRKGHLALDGALGDLRAVAFAPSRAGDSPAVPDLRAQTPQDDRIGPVTADGAGAPRRGPAALVERGAPALVPIRKNGRPWKENRAAATARTKLLRASRRFGRTL